ncbi:OX-2 membrane glycoprotein-like [Silurus meridionalis]|nr:OX-2 membrane glycoprotein-like [Silurus meridionalis]
MVNVKKTTDNLKSKNTSWFQCMTKMCRCVSVYLWLAVIMFPTLQAEVSAPAQLQATLGHPVTLGCNLTIGNGEDLKQVRWLDLHNKSVLYYQPNKPGSLIKREGVELIDQHIDRSSFVIERTKLGDEGCYTCVFDVYPSGQQKRTICLSLNAKAESMGNKTAVHGKQVTLSCTYALANRVHQILWKKTTEQGDTIIVASVTKSGNMSVELPFRERVKLSKTLGNSQLTIDPVHMEDEGCYTCDFHTYPGGSKSVTACLAVYILPKPEVSYTTTENGVIQANCSAVSRPPADLVWNVEGYNLTLAHSETSVYPQGDGTTLVVTTIQFQSQLLDEEQVTCTALHKGLETSISVSLNKAGYRNIIIISAAFAVLVLLICLCLSMKRR